MGFPANPAVGDVHVFTDETGRKINYEWACAQSAKPMTPSDLKLRRLIWDDGGTSIDPEDYEVFDAR